MDNENEFNFSTSNSFKKSPVRRSGSGFGKNVFVPFVSGIAGATLVIGTCFGVPSIKSKLLGSNTNGIISTSTQNSSNGSVNLVNISDYSKCL